MPSSILPAHFAAQMPSWTNLGRTGPQRGTVAPQNFLTSLVSEGTLSKGKMSKTFKEIFEVSCIENSYLG